MNCFRHFGRTPWTGDQPISRPLPTQDSITQEIADIRSWPRTGFEVMVTVFKQPKTIRVLDCSATVISHYYL